MSKKKLLLLCVGLILLVIVITQFVAVSLSGFTNVGGGCISVVFDKHFVCGADRIVVYEGDQVLTITEESTVRRIASEFVVANRTDLCGYYSDRRIEIYNGDKLVRSIRWNACWMIIWRILKFQELPCTTGRPGGCCIWRAKRCRQPG